MVDAGDTRMGNPIDVLMFEDDAGDVLLTNQLLEESRLAIRLTVAANGVEGLRMLRGEAPFTRPFRPHLVLLDLNMPQMNGLGVLEELKADPVLRMIPVVVLSDSESNQDVSDAYARHANFYVNKPLDLDQFAKIVTVMDEFWFTVVKLPRIEDRT